MAPSLLGQTMNEADWDALCETSKVTLVPFGKYKGKTLQTLLQDRNYCKWLLANTNIQTENPGMYAAIMGSKPESARNGHVRAYVSDVMGRPSPDFERPIPCVQARCSIGKGVSSYVGGQHRRSVWRAVLMLNERCSCGNKHLRTPAILQGARHKQ